jgi:hypothetical protein
MKGPLPPPEARLLDKSWGLIIIGRMIKNDQVRVIWAIVLAGSLVVGGCARPEPAPAEEIYQGVAELDERRLSFELAGRITSIRAR